MNEIFSFRVQWLEWLLSLVVLYGLFKPKKFEDRLDQKSAERCIAIVITVFFALALVAKYLQFHTLGLNAQDFWLFVDLLDSFNRGDIGVTHFAPQAFGPVQHGVIHPFIPWILLAPFSKVFSSVGLALLFGPLCFSIAAVFLNLIAQYLSLNSRTRLFLVTAFLFSKHAALTVMYDVHPEALYPLLALGLTYFLLVGRLFSACLMGLTLGLMKEDSFMVIWGVAVSSAFILKKPIRNYGKISLVFLVSVIGYIVQMKLIQYFSSHPGQGMIPLSGPIAGHKWDGAGSISMAAKALLEKNGGLFGSIEQFFRFLISDSWRALLLQSPWCVLSPGFWLAELPLAFSFSLRGDMAVFWNYYSAPFIAFLWMFAAKSLQNKNSRWGMALLFMTLVNGSEGVHLNFPRENLANLRNEAIGFNEELNRVTGKGVVLARLIPFVELKKVISDRLPASDSEKATVDFYFLEKERGNYNVPVESIQAQVSKLRDPNSGFKVAKETGQLILFTKI